jgi:hypothetical protein
MAIDDLDQLLERLRKKGFRQDDPLLHQCEACSKFAVARFMIVGRTGGRDITLCLECGRARSWRNAAGLVAREEDTEFDLRTFLG